MSQNSSGSLNHHCKDETTPGSEHHLVGEEKKAANFTHLQPWQPS